MRVIYSELHLNVHEGFFFPLVSHLSLLLFFRCWEQNINMNYWWIIRSPILLAVVVISSMLSFVCHYALIFIEK